MYTEPSDTMNESLQVQIIPDRDPSRWQAQVRTEQSRWLQLHSARDPLAEAGTQLAPMIGVIEASGTLVVVGIGLGYLAEAALIAQPGLRIVGIEPLPELLTATRSRVPALFSNSRVQLVAATDVAAIADLWRMFDDDREVEPPVVVHPVLERIAPERTRTAAAAMRRAIYDGRANARARRDHAGRYLLNTLRNVNALAASADVEALFDRFTGTPAVIVAAGPSLDRNVADIGSIANRVLVIAVDTALRPLLAHNIQPDIVVALDPSELNARHLLHLPPCPRTILLAEPSVDPRVLAAFAGRLVTFRVADHHPWPWLHAQGIERARLDVWGSVLTAAFDFALRAGCDPIAFAGADLAFSGGRTYCRGAAWEEDWARHAATGCSLDEIWLADVRRRPTVLTRDISGAEVETALHLISFRDWIAGRAARSGRCVVNGTGAGILHGPGIGQQPLRACVLENSAATSVTLPALATSFHSGIDAPGATDIEAWQHRAGVTDADITAALTDGNRNQHDGRTAHRDFDALPECTLTLRNAFERGSGGAAIGSPAELDAALAVAFRLLRSPGPIADACLGAPDLLRPVWTQFHWHEDATDDVLRLHRLSASLAAVVERPMLPHDAHLVGPSRSDREGVAIQPDVAARVLIALQTAWLQGATSRGGPGHRDIRMLARTVALFGSSSRMFPRTDGARGCELLLADAAVAMTGLVAGEAEPPEHVFGAAAGLAGESTASLPANVMIGGLESGDPRARFLGHRVQFIAPVPLTDRGLPRCYCGYIHDAGRAVFASTGRTHAFYISEDGGVEQGPDWPGPISGEIPWSTGGGALAWHAYEPRRIMLREGADAAVVSYDIPFAAFRVLVEPDGTTLWASHDGGLWAWRPGESATLVVDTPPVIGIHRTAALVRLDPVLRTADGGFCYQPPGAALLWDGVRHQLSTTPLDPDGPCWSESTAHGWTARAFDLTDQVALTHRDGRRFWLACETATSVAWAGRSLVVNTRAGEVFLFPLLAEHLCGWSVAS